MKRYSKWIKLAMLFCTALTVISAPLSTLAYMTARSNTLHNSFRVVSLPGQELSVPVMIQKSMVSLSEESIGPGGFDFCLVSEETGETTVMTTDSDGWAAVYLPFGEEDAGKTFRYRLYEQNGGRADVEYDRTVYELSITPVLSEGGMTAELTINGQPATELTAAFENRYYAPIPMPETGDHAHPALWAAMLLLSGAGLVVLRKKNSIFGRMEWIPRKSDC